MDEKQKISGEYFVKVSMEKFQINFYQNSLYFNLF